MKKSILFVVILIVACVPEDFSGASVVEVEPRELSTPLQVFFCPRDNCADHFLQFIQNTEETLYCALFDLDIPELINAFIQKSKVAEVRLVIDDHNVGKLDKWYFIRKDTSSQLSHNKFCVADGKNVWTGSFNPTYNGNGTNNNNVILLKSTYLAKNYEDEFWELWQGEFGKGGDVVRYPIVYLNDKKIENYFCPEDDCARKIDAVLNGATSSIDFMTFSFTHDALGDTIIKKYGEGITVRGIFEKSQNNAYLEMPKMELIGMNVRWDTNPKNMHHKVFIIDNEIVITGSMNPSKNGDERNDENVLILHDSAVATRYTDEFNRLWE